jgi:hypothetical protein
MINEIHPINNTPIDTAFPVIFSWLTLLKKCCSRAGEDLENDHQKVIEAIDEKIERT